MKSRRSSKKMILKLTIITFIITILAGVAFYGAYMYYDKVYLEKTSKIKITLNGDKNIELELNQEYEEFGATAKFRDKDITKSIKISGEVDNKKVGSYKISYTASTKNKSKKVERTITVVDKTAPVIKLKGNNPLSMYQNEEYKEPGFTATDNYDGDITSSVTSTNNIDKTKLGTYEVVYKVEDSSGNTAEEKRTVKVVTAFKTLPSLNAKATKIAVLNYHFFYDASKKEYSGDGNFTSVQTFEEQLKYLKDNNYKTLTMEEFRAWMYGERDLPARSVLITVDDGGRGTGRQNGNKLIPLLEKYDAHATLFLISGWWNKSNYTSSHLDIESHTHDMHTGNYCKGVSRGAQMLCLSDEEVLADLKKSIETVGSNTAFCYPLYVHNDHTMELVKQAGFKLAFIGGASKATRSTNKYKIPRYHMYKTTSLVEFNHMIA
ncbi:MAG: DUF5011 domain-containing protein [Bacilli bacterium]|nr:DUF5011 domain-containing protein [Bacilli bacterium]